MGVQHNTMSVVLHMRSCSMNAAFSSPVDCHPMPTLVRMRAVMTSLLNNLPTIRHKAQTHFTA